MTKWTVELIKEIEQKQEKAIVSAHGLLRTNDLTIDTVRAIVKSKSPNQSDDGGVVFIDHHHENLWTEMLNDSPGLLTEHFVEHVQDRLLLQDWVSE